MGKWTHSDSNFWSVEKFHLLVVNKKKSYQNVEVSCDLFVGGYGSLFSCCPTSTPIFGIWRCCWKSHSKNCKYFPCICQKWLGSPSWLKNSTILKLQNVQLYLKMLPCLKKFNKSSD